MINELYPAPSTTEEDAFALVRAATNISRARKQNDAAALTVALDENLQLWTAIQTLMEKKDHPLPAQTKENLLKLAKFVVSKTVSEGCEASDKTLDTLENMNLQIARGLMESIRLPPRQRKCRSSHSNGSAFGRRRKKQRQKRPDRSFGHKSAFVDRFKNSGGNETSGRCSRYHRKHRKAG